MIKNMTVIALALYCSIHSLQSMELSIPNELKNLKTPEDFMNALTHIKMLSTDLDAPTDIVYAHEITEEQKNDLNSFKFKFFSLNKNLEDTIYLRIPQKDFESIVKCSQKYHMSIEKAYNLYMKLKNK